jgi:hypothetical protein
MNKFNFAVVVMVLILGWSFKGSAQTVQYVTIVATNFNGGTASYLPLQTNQIVSWVGNASSVNVFMNFPSGATVPFLTTSGTFTGLTNIIVSQAGNGAIPAVATFQITTPSSANVVSNYVPADAIVIPASATGNVQIILESSPDLVNWTAASPGTYGASAGTNRFFRVRAVAN